MNTKTNLFQIARNTAISIFLAVTCGILIMIGLYSINTDNIQRHVKTSIPVYQQEHLYFFISPNIHSTMLDNLSDAIMLNIAAYKGERTFKSIKNNALLNPRYEYKNLSPYDSLIKAYSQTDDSYEIISYPRYWHGYLLYLKPLLLFFNLGEIRCINMAVQLLLLFLVILELYKKGGRNLILPYLCAIYVLNPLSTALCLTFSSMYYITLIGTLVMLKKEIYKSPDYFYFFLWLGILTPFFDFLTYPLIGLGINLIILTALSDSQNPIKRVFSSLLFWITGYISMGSAKWISVSILTKQNIMNNGFSQFIHRINGTENFLQQYTIADVIKSNLNALINKPFCMLIICVLIYFIYLLISKKYQFKFDLNKNTALLLITLFPFIWFILIQNHSIVHHWFVHKDFAVTVMALVYILISSFNHNCDEEKF